MLSEISVASEQKSHTSFFETRQLKRYAGIWSLWRSAWER